MKRLKVGVIGCGVMGGFHIRQFKNIPEAEIIGASDIDPARAPQGIKFFTDYHELLKTSEAVSITSPTSTHYEVALDAIDAGCHVMIEKPISLTAAQAEGLIKRAKERGVVLAVGHIERFNPAYTALFAALKKRRPDVIDIKRLSPFPDRITDVSCVIDMMIHDIDLARKIANSDVKYVNATGEMIRTKRLDKALAVICYENGTIANIEASRVHDSKARKMVVLCGKDALEADLLNKKAFMIKNETRTELKISDHDQLQCELKDFISAIINKKKPSVTGEDGMAAIDIANRVEEEAIKQC